uniref:Uncharacterized protein n=1 Tax=Chromera velia CCMP2878 TaxID=1169474 RepID=A0A0G4GTH4_9ALVE|eukprot:Cvel_23253.t1-p1 / transcript=Cvel_23253.t1 / gene=Cvel_23253 / organism=Chromera_velia_CCMP2878 / gene_product=hypothetical protein / transcript_product=hypothetical protein / location=Cvel_scaffold2376:18710-23921(-) / protein_length=576 / sequence_SO=supercontig / SO=protein_coding / is_pseudo=false
MGDVQSLPDVPTPRSTSDGDAQSQVSQSNNPPRSAGDWNDIAQLRKKSARISKERQMWKIRGEERDPDEAQKKAARAVKASFKAADWKFPRVAGTDEEGREAFQRALQHFEMEGDGESLIRNIRAETDPKVLLRKVKREMDNLRADKVVSERLQKAQLNGLHQLRETAERFAQYRTSVAEEREARERRAQEQEREEWERRDREKKEKEAQEAEEAEERQEDELMFERPAERELVKWTRHWLTVGGGLSIDAEPCRISHRCLYFVADMIKTRTSEPENPFTYIQIYSCSEVQLETLLPLLGAIMGSEEEGTKPLISLKELDIARLNMRPIDTGDGYFEIDWADVLVDLLDCISVQKSAAGIGRPLEIIGNESVPGGPEAVRRVRQKEADSALWLQERHLRCRERPMLEGLFFPAQTTDEKMRAFAETLAKYRGGVSEGLYQMKYLQFGSGNQEYAEEIEFGLEGLKAIFSALLDGVGPVSLERLSFRGCRSDFLFEATAFGAELKKFVSLQMQKKSEDIDFVTLHGGEWYVNALSPVELEKTGAPYELIEYFRQQSEGEQEMVAKGREAYDEKAASS